MVKVRRCVGRTKFTSVAELLLFSRELVIISVLTTGFRACEEGVFFGFIHAAVVGFGIRIQRLFFMVLRGGSEGSVIGVLFLAMDFCCRM